MDESVAKPASLKQRCLLSFETEQVILGSAVSSDSLSSKTKNFNSLILKWHILDHSLNRNMPTLYTRLKPTDPFPHRTVAKESLQPQFVSTPLCLNSGLWLTCTSN